jgi:hypothetical protein
MVCFLNACCSNLSGRWPQKSHSGHLWRKR